MMRLSNLFLCWLWCCSLLVIEHTSPYIPLSSSHHGTWQRFLLCSLKTNPTHLQYGTVVLPGMGGEGRGRRGGNVAVMGAVGVPYCKTMLQRVNYKPELLHVPVTVMRGPTVSFT